MPHRRLIGLLPRRSDYAGFTRGWKADLVAGITVGVVALPLALGFGITTGLGAASGLVTAVVAGLVAAVFGGSNVQVSGPTGAMTVVLVPVVATYGADAVVVVGIMAGVLVLASGVAGVGRYLAYVPWPVVEGFTVGIAVIIFLQQVPTALGVPKPEGDNAALVALEALGHVTADSLPSIAVVVGTAIAVALLPRLHRSLPASLIAIAVAAVVCSVADVDVAVIGDLPRSLPLPSVPSVSLDEVRSLLSPALAVAILCALESLLSARVADGMSGIHHRHAGSHRIVAVRRRRRRHGRHTP
jgi:SulP family sulfate permease